MGQVIETLKENIIAVHAETGLMIPLRIDTIAEEVKHADGDKSKFLTGFQILTQCGQEVTPDKRDPLLVKIATPKMIVEAMLQQPLDLKPFE